MPTSGSEVATLTQPVKPSEDGKGSDRKPRTRWFGGLLQLWGAIASIIGLVAGAAGIYLMTARGGRQLELRYVAKLDVLNQEASPPQVRISYAGTEVKRLTKIRASLTNIGAIPIQRGDIERPMVLDLHSATLLNGGIVKTDPPGVEAQWIPSRHSVVIEHGLLNPGDSIEFEMLCDGDPGWPQPIVRVSGMKAVSLSLPSADKHVRFNPLFLQLPRPVEMVALIFITIAGVGLSGVLAVAYAIGVVWPEISRTRSLKQVEKALAAAEQTRLGREATIRDVYFATPPHLQHRVWQVSNAVPAAIVEMSPQFYSELRRVATAAINNESLSERVLRRDVVTAVMLLPGFILVLGLTIGLIAGSWRAFLNQ